MSEQDQAPRAPDAAGGSRVRQVVYPVSDIAEGVAFYRAAFGFPEKFVDGDRYAALDGGDVAWALAAPAEDVAGIAAAAVKVVDVESTLDQVVAAGGEVVRASERGPHEVRAVVRDPWGNAVIVYSPVSG